MNDVPVVVVGGGPVGMTLALVLAFRGVRSLVVERNPHTTRHPKMNITNARSMELYRQIGLERALRAVAVPETSPFDVSWITSLTGYELHRFRYPSVVEARQLIRTRNDGAQPCVPAMRVSQVQIEPILKRALEQNPLVKVRFGVSFEDFSQDADGVSVTLRNASLSTETVRCLYLAGCDGGGSAVRAALDIGLSGQRRVMQRFMTHFRSEARDVLQPWGIAWHYQSSRGTLIAENDRDLWTINTRLAPDVDVNAVNPALLVEKFAGRSFDFNILVANSWYPHLLIADGYGHGRVFLAGDAVHQYIPTGAYGLNTGIGDAFDLGWKLAAVLQGLAGPNLLASYELERRPIGLRNLEASKHHNVTRVAIGRLYSPALDLPGADGEAARRDAASQIQSFGNAENESYGIEMGYVYKDSPITCGEAHDAPPEDPVRYVPTIRPGARLPSIFLPDGRPLYDLLGSWFTLLTPDRSLSGPVIDAARRQFMPLSVVDFDPAEFRCIYKSAMILVRPDQHIAWSGSALESSAAELVVARALGWHHSAAGVRNFR